MHSPVEAKTFIISSPHSLFNFSGGCSPCQLLWVLGSPSCVQHGTSPSSSSSFHSSSHRRLAHMQHSAAHRLPLRPLVGCLAARLGTHLAQHLCKRAGRMCKSQKSKRAVKCQVVAHCAEVTEGAGRELVTSFLPLLPSLSVWQRDSRAGARAPLPHTFTITAAKNVWGNKE